LTTRGQSSFVAHLLATALVTAIATALGVSRLEWCILVLCIALVMTAELLNTSLEQLAKVHGPDFNPRVRDALDIGSGAVLAAAIGAVIAGALILLPRLLDWAQSTLAIPSS
jgi:diacylglycerol kinase